MWDDLIIITIRAGLTIKVFEFRHIILNLNVKGQTNIGNNYLDSLFFICHLLTYNFLIHISAIEGNFIRLESKMLATESGIWERDYPSVHLRANITLFVRWRSSENICSLSSLHKFLYVACFFAQKNPKTKKKRAHPNNKNLTQFRFGRGVHTQHDENPILF